MTDVTIDFADGDDECLEIHRFLCLVAQPVLMAPINAEDSIAGILKVVSDPDCGFALVARADGELVGTLGLTDARWWYNTQVGFFTDRWFFVLPAFQHLGVGTRLLAEAAVIGSQAGRDIVINGHLKRRAKSIGRGIVFTAPSVLGRGG
jgi:GNAT superfamily N-acetyltransferase